jgi:hypothetical protein
MTTKANLLSSLVLLLATLGSSRAADDALSRAQIAKIGKRATALVEVKGRGFSGSAFCVHRSGLFVTNEHVAQGDLTLVLDRGLKYPARVIRADKNLDLAVLRVERARGVPALTLGSDDGLEELAEVVALGFPPGPPPAPGSHDYPAVSASVGSITSLPHKGGRLERIQLDTALSPGHAGGPVLDRQGKVIGVVAAAGPGGAGSAIPAGAVARLLAPPEVQFDPPALDLLNIYKPARFRVQLTPLLRSAPPCTVDLIVKASRRRSQTHRLQAHGDRHEGTLLPVPPPEGPLKLRLLARFDNGTLNATVTDRTFKVGAREMQLSQVACLRAGAVPGVVLHNGETVEGTVTDLDKVPVPLGEQTLSVNLAAAREVTLTPVDAIDQVEYTLVVRQGNEEVFRQSQSVAGPGLKYVLLPLGQAACAVSTKSMFTGGGHERMIFPTWGKQDILGIPFDVQDPKGDSVKNAIVLYGPGGSPAREMPTAVRLTCGSPARAIHLLSGVAGWGWPGYPSSVCMTVRLHYRDGVKEDHELINGVHFCDIAGYQDGKPLELSGSRFAIELIKPDGAPRYIRHLAIAPKDPDKVIEEIEFVKDPAVVTCPVVMAATIEKPSPGGDLKK